MPVSGARSAVDFVPRIDIDETDEAIEVRAELPGLDEKDFEVLVDANVLEIKGEREESREDLVHHETSRGSFGRKLRLAFEPDPDAVKASYAKGVLTVTIPKPEEEQPKVRTIPVTAS